MLLFYWFSYSYSVQVDYGKKAEEAKKYYSYGVDANEIQQAFIADKLASKVETAFVDYILKNIIIIVIYVLC